MSNNPTVSSDLEAISLHPKLENRIYDAIDAAAAAHLNRSSGDGTSGGMEARVARLESDVAHIRTDITDVKADLRDLRKDGQRDFRILFGAVIVATLGLAGLMARGFGWI